MTLTDTREKTRLIISVIPLLLFILLMSTCAVYADETDGAQEEAQEEGRVEEVQEADESNRAVPSDGSDGSTDLSEVLDALDSIDGRLEVIRGSTAGMDGKTDDLKELSEEMRDALKALKEYLAESEYKPDDIYRGINEANKHNEKILEAAENSFLALYDIKALMEDGTVSAGEVGGEPLEEEEMQLMAIRTMGVDNAQVVGAISDNSGEEVSAISENRRVTVSLLDVVVELDGRVRTTNNILYALGVGLVFLVGIKLAEMVTRWLPNA